MCPSAAAEGDADGAEGAVNERGYFLRRPVQEPRPVLLNSAGDAGDADFACGGVLLNGYSVVKGPRRRKNACCSFLTCRVAGDDGSGADVVEM